MRNKSSSCNSFKILLSSKRLTNKDKERMLKRNLRFFKLKMKRVKENTKFSLHKYRQNEIRCSKII